MVAALFIVLAIVSIIPIAITITSPVMVSAKTNNLLDFVSADAYTQKM